MSQVLRIGSPGLAELDSLLGHLTRSPACQPELQAHLRLDKDHLPHSLGWWQHSVPRYWRIVDSFSGWVLAGEPYGLSSGGPSLLLEPPSVPGHMELPSMANCFLTASTGKGLQPNGD